MSGIKTRIYNGYKQYNDGTGWKFTHRRVAEKILGHTIPENHEVHHINRNTQDNRPENLAILSKEEHRKIHNTSQNNANNSFLGNPLKSIMELDEYIFNSSLKLDSIFLESEITNMVAIDLQIINLNSRKREIESRINQLENNESNVNQKKNLMSNLEDIYIKLELLESKKRKSQDSVDKTVKEIGEKYSKMAEDMAKKYTTMIDSILKDFKL